MNFESRLQKYPPTGRLTSALTGRAALNGSLVVLELQKRNELSIRRNLLAAYFHLRPQSIKEIGPLIEDRAGSRAVVVRVRALETREDESDSRRPLRAAIQS